jgi:hypothetical protein
MMGLLVSSQPGCEKRTRSCLRKKSCFEARPLSQAVPTPAVYGSEKNATAFWHYQIDSVFSHRCFSEADNICWNLRALSSKAQLSGLWHGETRFFLHSPQPINQTDPVLTRRSVEIAAGTSQTVPYLLPDCRKRLIILQTPWYELSTTIASLHKLSLCRRSNPPRRRFPHLTSMVFAYNAYSRHWLSVVFCPGVHRR